MVADTGQATSAVADTIGQGKGGFAFQGCFFVAELLGGATDTPFLHVGIGSDFGIHVVSFEQNRQREGEDEKADNADGD